MRYREPNRSDWGKRIGFILAYVAFIASGAFFVMPQGITGKVIFGVMVLGGFLLLFWGLLRDFAFRCGLCEHEFEVSLITKITSPHGVVWYELRCPECRRRTRAKTLIKG